MINGVNFKGSVPEQNVKQMSKEQEEKLRKLVEMSDKVNDIVLSGGLASAVINPVGYFFASQSLAKQNAELKKQLAVQTYNETVQKIN